MYFTGEFKLGMRVAHLTDQNVVDPAALRAAFH